MEKQVINVPSTFDSKIKGKSRTKRLAQKKYFETQQDATMQMTITELGTPKTLNVAGDLSNVGSQRMYAQTVKSDAPSPAPMSLLSDSSVHKQTLQESNGLSRQQANRIKTMKMSNYFSPQKPTFHSNERRECPMRTKKKRKRSKEEGSEPTHPSVTTKLTTELSTICNDQQQPTSDE